MISDSATSKKEIDSRENLDVVVEMVASSGGSGTTKHVTWSVWERLFSKTPTRAPTMYRGHLHASTEEIYRAFTEESYHYRSKTEESYPSKEGDCPQQSMRDNLFYPTQFLIAEGPADREDPLAQVRAAQHLTRNPTLQTHRNSSYVSQLRSALPYISHATLTYIKLVRVPSSGINPPLSSDPSDRRSPPEPHHNGGHHTRTRARVRFDSIRGCTNTADARPGRR